MSDPSDADLLIGSSAVMHAVREQIARVAQFPWPVRIEGPRGTGKNLAAKTLHRATGRSGRFVRCGLNIVSAAEGRELAELVGWTRGAFTGAYNSQPGVFERAHQGTAFLNELGLASSRVQEILLDLLEDNTVQRLGECVPRSVDVRLVFATNAALEMAVRAGSFRADLYDRLGIEVIQMPALRKRPEDIPELAAAFVIRLARECGIEPQVLRPAEIDRLMSYEWPGNVRDLENALKHRTIHHDLPACIPARGRGTWYSAIGESLAKHQGNKSAAARELGVSRKTLYQHLRDAQPKKAGGDRV